jgi:hypothetical protein
MRLDDDSTGMKRLGIASAIVLAACLASTQYAAGATRSTRSSCAPAGSRVLAADAQVMIYSKIEVIAPHHEEGTAIHGCAYGHRSYLVGTLPNCPGAGPCGGPEHEVLAGPLVAYEEGGGGKVVNIYQVVVRNLRTGRVIRELPTGTPSPRPGWVGIGPTTGIVVKSDGAVAWIVETGFPTTYQVHAVDSNGSRVLASGSDIDPSSLALADETIYWTAGSTAMSAPLN